MNSAALGTACRARFFSFAAEWEAVITDDPLHIGYLCGYRSILHDMMPYQQLLIATRNKCFLVTGASDAAAALEVLGQPEAIHRYGTFHVYGGNDLPDCSDMPQASASFEEAINAVIASIGTGFDAALLDLHRPATQAAVALALPNLRSAPAADIFQRSRAVKLPGELNVLRHAARVTDRAVETAAAMIHPGVTELELAAEISRQIVQGGGIPRFVVVTSGERTSRVDTYATHRQLRNGDLVRIDLGGSFQGYNSDMARSFCVGKPDPLALARYDALLRGELAELATVRAGVLAADVYAAAMREVRAGALPDYNRNHCGHGIGLRANEFPLLGPASNVPLEVGMVLCVETPYYEIGWGGMMVEDIVIVTEDGYEMLTPSSRAFLRDGCLDAHLRA